MDEELELYISEVKDLLREMETVFLQAEKSPSSWQEPMHNGFRTIHTIKANSMYMDYEKVANSCHLAEMFLANKDRSPRLPEPEEFEILFRFIDALNEFIDNLKSTHTPNERLLNPWIFLYKKYNHGKETRHDAN